MRAIVIANQMFICKVQNVLLYLPAMPQGEEKAKRRALRDPLPDLIEFRVSPSEHWYALKGKDKEK